MNRWMACATIGALAAGLAGCEQKHDGMSMAEAMKPPPRAAELARLDPLEGKWEEVGECDMGGQKMSMTGMTTNTWECDRTVMVGRGEMAMADSPDKMHGLSIWMWDAKDRTYKTFWMDSTGGIAHGTATYDAATNTWKMSAKGRNTHTGETTVGEGTMQMTDHNTMKWAWTEWDSWKLKKIMSMSGTTRRRP